MKLVTLRCELYILNISDHQKLISLGEKQTQLMSLIMLKANSKKKHINQLDQYFLLITNIVVLFCH